MFLKAYNSVSQDDISGWNKFCRLITVLLLLTALPLAGLYSQNKARLEVQRKQLLKEIQQTSERLKETRKNKEEALSHFLALQSQINKRQKLLKTYRDEILYTESSIQRTNEVVDALNGDLQHLKREYGRIMRGALRQKLHQSYLAFLFSAGDLNEAFRRWQYIRQYDRYRKKQFHLILDTQRMLEDKSTQLEEEKKEKQQLLADLLRQNQNLSQELEDKDVLLSSLKSNEKQLALTLEKQEQAAARLQATIEEVIRRDMLANSNPVEAAANSVVTTTPVVLSGNFSSAKGKLPWPVGNGEIVRPFGVQFHPKFKNVKVSNNGIDIRTARNAPVRAIFQGKVAGTQFIPGFKNTVIIQHGEYYTVYSNLSSIYVGRGDVVDANQEIGKVGASDPEMHFEVWKEKERLNPSDWVRGK